MTDFDAEYTGKKWFYGSLPSPQLELFIKHDNLPTQGGAIDVGCGNGRNALFMARQGYQVTGVDQSAAGIQQMLETAQAEGLNINGVVSDVCAHHYPSETYTLVVANTIFDHLEVEEGNLLIQQLKDSIIPGGYIFVTVFSIHDPGYVGQSKSNTNQYVKRYFHTEEVRELFSDLPLLRLQEEEYLDTAHGEPHFHAVIRLMAQKID